MEVRKLNESISKLHAELAVTKNANNLLLTRLTTLERQWWANAQYSRWKCLDIVVILCEVSGEILEENVLKIFRKLGCDISSDHIEAYHRVGRTTDTVIVKFSKRKDCQHIWSVKKDLMKLTLEDSELPENNKLSISHIINCCSLKARNFIASVNNSFGKHFPDVDLSPPSRTS